MRTALVIAVLSLMALIASSEIALAQAVYAPGQANPYAPRNPVPFPVITPVPGLANVLNYGRSTQSGTVRPAYGTPYGAPVAPQFNAVTPATP